MNDGMGKEELLREMVGNLEGSGVVVALLEFLFVVKCQGTIGDQREPGYLQRNSRSGGRNHPGRRGCEGYIWNDSRASEVSRVGRDGNASGGDGGRPKD